MIIIDTLYIGDIPQDYCYAVFNNNFIDLYNTPILQGDLKSYRIYLYDNNFFYTERTVNYNNYNTSVAQKIEVSDNYMYRRDYDSICTISFIFCLLIIFLLNIVTSVFKKGGLLGGLL